MTLTYLKLKVQLVSDHVFPNIICPKKPMIFLKMAASINRKQTRAVLSREQEISNVLKADNVKEKKMLMHEMLNSNL